MLGQRLRWTNLLDQHWFCWEVILPVNKQTVGPTVSQGWVNASLVHAYAAVSYSVYFQYHLTAGLHQYFCQVIRCRK